MPERRHEEELAGFFFGRRHYTLSRIGKGLVVFSGVAGIVGGCFFWTLNFAGKQVVDTDAEFKRTTISNDSASLVQRKSLQLAVDSLHADVRDLQEQVALVGLTSCAQLRADAPEWLKEKCRSVLQKGGR